MLIGKFRKYSNILQIADVVLRIIFLLCFSQYFAYGRFFPYETSEMYSPSVKGSIIWQFNFAALFQLLS